MRERESGGVRASEREREREREGERNRREFTARGVKIDARLTD